jgi:hypothetical protein
VDLGAPISYLVLDKGLAVYDPDGNEVGKVERVLAAPEEDIFDGIVIDTAPGPGGWRFADAEQVASLHERGVQLHVGKAELHEPSENPAVMDADPAEEKEGAGRALEERLKRAWDYISGNY